MPIYHCMHCGFTFKREGKPDRCPDCGKPNVRAALKQEVAEFASIHKKEHKTQKYLD